MENRKLFREMSEPHESRAALAKAFEEFWEELQQSRQKHKIQNLVVIVQTSYVSEDGEEFSNLGVSSLGDGNAAESMCAYGYGSFKAQREEMMARLLKGKT